MLAETRAVRREGIGFPRFTDQEHDAETDLLYYGARYYDPWVGRFLSQDPALIGAYPGVTFHRIATAPQNLNAYTYALSRPTTLIDPTGESYFDALNNILGSCGRCSLVNDVKAVTTIGGGSSGGSTNGGATSNGGGEIGTAATGQIQTQPQKGSKAGEIVNSRIGKLAVADAVGQSRARQQLSGDNNPIGAPVFSDRAVSELTSLEQVETGRPQADALRGMQGLRGTVGTIPIRGAIAIGGVLQPTTDDSSLRSAELISALAAGSLQAGGIPIFVAAGRSGAILIVEAGFAPVILERGLQ